MTKLLETSGAVALALAVPVGLSLAAHADDDHADHYGAATLLPVGATLPGEIDGEGDKDVFRLDLVGTSTINVRTTGQTDTSGELLGWDGSRIVQDDDSGPGDNFSLEETLDAGVYYVVVTPSSGQDGIYAINARVGNSPDHGGTIESATLLKVHTRNELGRVMPQVLLATAGRIHPSTDDADVFRIDVPKKGTAVTVRTSGGTDTYGTFMDSRGNEYTTADNGDGNFSITETLDNAGVYYVRVNGHETGAYRILAAVTTPEPDDGYCRTDDNIRPGGRCNVYQRNNVRFVVSDTSYWGCLSGPNFFRCASKEIEVPGDRSIGLELTFMAERLANNSWAIHDVKPEPPAMEQ